jgi:hypothetical protein
VKKSTLCTLVIMIMKKIDGPLILGLFGEFFMIDTSSKGT